MGARNVAAMKPRDNLGGVFRAPLGTPIPTDDSAPLDPAFKPLGLISDAGITPSRDISVDKPKAWGGDIVAALVTDESRSFEFTLLEVYSEEVQKFVHGENNVTVTAATASSGTKIAVLDKGGKPEQCVMAFKMRHEGKTRMVFVHVADPTITGEEPWTDGGLSAYTVTVEALKDESGTRVSEFLSNDDKTAV